MERICRTNSTSTTHIIGYKEPLKVLKRNIPQVGDLLKSKRIAI